MYPVRILSINDGWSNLQNNKLDEWRDIVGALLDMTVEAALHPSNFIEKKYHVNDATGARTFINEVWYTILKKYGWEEGYKFSEKKEGSYIYINSSKNEVSTKYITNNLFHTDELQRYLLVDCPRMYAAGVCNTFVVIVPSATLEEIFPPKKDGFYGSEDRIFTEVQCSVQVDELLPFLGDFPIIVVIYSQYEQEVQIEERGVVRQHRALIERIIEFEPEYYQAGVGILSYFGEVLRQKYPDVNAKVRIEQDGNVVRMRIETPTGENEVIERELEKYALVIANQLPPSALLENKIHVMQLENKLSMAELEIRQTKNALQLAENLYGGQVRSLEQQIAFFRDLVSEQLRQQGKGADVLAQQLASHERIQLAQIGHAQGLFKDLLGEAHGNQVLLNAIRSLEYNLMTGITTIDVQEQVKESLATIKEQNPSLLSRVAAQLESAGYGLLAAPAFEWLKQQMQQYQ